MREITNKYLFTRRPGKNNRAYGRVDNTINFATPSVHNTNVVTWFQHRPLSSLHQKAVFRKFCRVWHVTDRWPVDCSWPLRLNFSTAPSYYPSKLSLFKSTCRSESSYIMLSLLTITGLLGLGKWVIDWGKQSRPWFVHGESVSLAWFPADLLYRVADVLLVIWEPGALGGRRYRLSIDIVIIIIISPQPC